MSSPHLKRALRRLIALSLLCACNDSTSNLREDAASSADSAAPDDAGLVGNVDASAMGSDAQTPRADASSSDASSTSSNGDAALDAAASDAAPLDARAPLSVNVLRETTLDSGVFYQLLRLQQGDAAASFAQWFPPPDGGMRPVVIATKPYDGIDWTGEALDTRWAQQGQGLHPDVDGPRLADGGAPTNAIAYTPLAPEKADEAALYRLHNFGTLLLYGRYYAGGDVQNDIDDMTLGFEFLAQSPLVDRTRIGIFGGSWGGFEALYGAAYARADLRPKVGVGLSPLSDFQREEDFVTRELPMLYTRAENDEAAALFFEPYLRRMHATTTRRGGYDGLRAQDLVARIKSPFLLIHEDWDTLVSFDQSSKLVELAPSVFKPLWILHSTPASWDTVVNGHGPLLTQFAQLAGYTFLTAFLLTQLGDPGQPLYAVWDTASMRKLFVHMHTLQRAGVNVSFFAQRLIELTDPRLIALDFTSGASLGAAAAVARELNLEWKTSFTAENVAANLAGGLPAP